MPLERLQKIIAAAGIASRRKAEELITQGRVSVNGQTVSELASHLTRAASHVPKTYLVKTSGRPAPDGLEKLRRGIKIGPKPGPRRAAPMHTAPAQVRLMKDATNPWYEVTLIEGKNRQIRRMFEEIGHHVEKIKRVRYGPLTLDVHPGEFRELTVKEVSALRQAKPGQILAPPARDHSKGFKGRDASLR